ncbi:FABP family protein [Propionicicella superfundia]|uniref:FABP family protein n=1 Tax=Propionicicella superfundia TaxID=348582 RepID=UPI0006855E97|nr:FABP family protein [Propionicicella superfundia]
MRGRWEGTGYRQWPGQDKSEFFCQVEFNDNGGPFLHYLCQTFTVDAELRPAEPLWMEGGFWRPLADGVIEVSLSTEDGVAELLYGKVQPGRIEVVTDAVVRPPQAAVEYTGGRRLYGNVDGKLLWSFDRATTQHELQSWMWATLVRA